MHKRFTDADMHIEPRMLTASEACAYAGMGRTRGREWLAEIGAKRKFGSAARYDRKVIDAALDRMSEDNAG